MFPLCPLGDAVRPGPRIRTRDQATGQIQGPRWNRWGFDHFHSISLMQNSSFDARILTKMLFYSHFLSLIMTLVSAPQPYWSVRRCKRPSARPRPKSAFKDHGASSQPTGEPLTHARNQAAQTPCLLCVVAVFVGQNVGMLQAQEQQDQRRTVPLSHRHSGYVSPTSSPDMTINNLAVLCARWLIFYMSHVCLTLFLFSFQVWSSRPDPQ